MLGSLTEDTYGSTRQLFFREAAALVFVSVKFVTFSLLGDSQS